MKQFLHRGSYINVIPFFITIVFLIAFLLFSQPLFDYLSTYVGDISKLLKNAERQALALISSNYKT